MRKNLLFFLMLYTSMVTTSCNESIRKEDLTGKWFLEFATDLNTETRLIDVHECVYFQFFENDHFQSNVYADDQGSWKLSGQTLELIKENSFEHYRVQHEKEVLYLEDLDNKIKYKFLRIPSNSIRELCEEEGLQ